LFKEKQKRKKSEEEKTRETAIAEEATNIQRTDQTNENLKKTVKNRTKKLTKTEIRSYMGRVPRAARRVLVLIRAAAE
jgi:hypothetical protein